MGIGNRREDHGGRTAARLLAGCGFLWLGLGPGWTAGPAVAADDPPPLQGPIPAAGRSTTPDPDPRDEAPGLTHEATLDRERVGGPVRVSKAPPAPVDERPGPGRPGPDARWVRGYWAWDPARGDFAWVGGLWLAPPADRIWVDGRWQRDARGWVRVPGFWSERRGAAAVAAAAAGRDAADRRAAWRVTGPPADRPDNPPGPAPDADAFYVPGHYRPDGERLVWTAGFWARARAGWDWVPARWVRRPDGWDYREGYWTRDPAVAGGPEGRPAAVRPPDLEPDRDLDRDRDRDRDRADLPPAIVDSEPGADADADAKADGVRERPAPGDPAAGPPVVVTPGGRVVPYPYPSVVPRVYVAPYPYGPGAYPPSGKLYDPYGYVGASVPPFVRRMLDRVLP